MNNIWILHHLWTRDYESHRTALCRRHLTPPETSSPKTSSLALLCRAYTKASLTHHTGSESQPQHSWLSHWGQGALATLRSLRCDSPISISFQTPKLPEGFAWSSKFLAPLGGNAQRLLSTRISYSWLSLFSSSEMGDGQNIRKPCGGPHIFCLERRYQHLGDYSHLLSQLLKF